MDPGTSNDVPVMLNVTAFSRNQQDESYTMSKYIHEFYLLLKMNFKCRT